MTNDEVKQVREYLYFLASLEVEVNNEVKANENDQGPVVL